MGIIHAWVRLVLDLFAPGTGRRRAGARPPAPPGTARAPRPGPDAGRLPVPRSPYGLTGPIEGEATVLVRPYLLAHEARQRQAWRRVALVLAADFGIDLDGRDLHGAGAAR
ncbi:hypothetical protein LUX12_03245 [Streptomyces somaliensis]|uniref:hypothetical protein n=1 Tax=Streptomyces somaliensis TaxID=78355 RepID=UPI0020CED1F4|nr:hypothetical protein [Streptomyces somaliensis]MCP9944024.1 hypothetical protein [Streptomyces somaliensis]MCP9962736.1 hypothetical protein [Streptomyces somaliensis]MCP9975571.1 hypothetical protein [Streptomyces somaliensis]